MALLASGPATAAIISQGTSLAPAGPLMSQGSGLLCDSRLLAEVPDLASDPRQDLGRRLLSLPRNFLRAFGQLTGAARAFCSAANRSIRGPASASAREGLKAPLRLASRLISSIPRRLGLRNPPVVIVHNLFSQVGDLGSSDFFLFIKDYGWSLRYRIGRLIDGTLNLIQPLKLDWVKLRKPIKDSKKLLTTPSEELFNWDIIKPPNHKGFKYRVAGMIGDGVEAVINFLDGRGVSLLVGSKSIQLLDRSQPQEVVKAVTHSWIQCIGMPLLPIVKSVTFFDVDKPVVHWHG